MLSFGKSKSKNAMCMFCDVTTIVIGVLAVIAALFAVVAVYKAHVLSSGLTFGTSNGSLALIALAVNLFLVKKVAASCGCACSLPSKK